MRRETKLKNTKGRADEEGKGTEIEACLSAFPDLEDDKMFWYLHEAEKVLKLA